VNLHGPTLMPTLGVTWLRILLIATLKNTKANKQPCWTLEVIMSRLDSLLPMLTEAAVWLCRASSSFRRKSGTSLLWSTFHSVVLSTDSEADIVSTNTTWSDEFESDQGKIGANVATLWYILKLF